MVKNKISRRKFITQTSCGALCSTSLLSSLFNLRMSSNLACKANNPDDYKALVCIMLRGGNDGFNTIIPFDNESYNEYLNARTVLALQKNKLIKINPLSSNGKEYAFHPSATKLAELFDSGQLAIVSNVGTLVQPTTKTEVSNGIKLPSGLFSHSDQALHWQTSIPQSSSSTGWAGRVSDILQSANLNQEISMNISLSGKNVFQLGNMTSEYSILPIGNGSVGIKGYNETSTFDEIRTSIVKSLMEQQYQDVFKQSYADIVASSQNAHELFSEAISLSELQTNFSSSSFSQNLKMVARTIQAREQLGVRRQTFFIQLDGWDHHDDLLSLHEDLLKELSDGLHEFNLAMKELNVQDQVTSFTISDFGRTLSSNGDGSDHAWGSHMLVMGGQVDGQKVYGKYPQLATNANNIIDGNIVLPSLSTDEYFAELSIWFGVSPSDLAFIFPNLGNFYNAFSGINPIGFMNMNK